MAKILALLDLVPSWAWALAVATLAALCIRLDIVSMQAQAEASKARGDLATIRAQAATDLANERERARKEERRLSAAVLEAQRDLTQEKADRAGRAADLTDRLRNSARPLACRPSASGAPSATPRTDGHTGPGLLGVDGSDLVVLDATARADLVEFTLSAVETGKALTRVRGMLRECWKRGPD